MLPERAARYERTNTGHGHITKGTREQQSGCGVFNEHPAHGPVSRHALTPTNERRVVANIIVCRDYYHSSASNSVVTAISIRTWPLCFLPVCAARLWCRRRVITIETEVTTTLLRIVSFKAPLVLIARV